MDYKIIEKATKNIVRHAGSYIATHELLKILWDKYIAEMKGYTKRYNFNCTNEQTIEFEIDGYIHRFENVPTSMGTLNITPLNNEIIKIYEEMR